MVRGFCFSDGAIDTAMRIVVSYTSFEGEKSFGSPVRPNGLRVGVPNKCVATAPSPSHVRSGAGERRSRIEL